MKTLWTLWYRLTMKDFDSRITMAKKYNKILKESTNARCNHFYNEQGEQIRGFHKRSARFNNVLPTHPLLVKYQ
jgi:hypothetical protein